MKKMFAAKLLAVLLFFVTVFNSCSGWEQVGMKQGVAIDGASPTIIFNKGTNEVYLGYSDKVLNAFVIKKFTGSEWIQVGYPLTAVGTTPSIPSLSIDSYLKPGIAYNDDASHSFLIKTYDGATWRGVGDAMPPSNVASASSLAFDPVSTEPYVAYPVISNFIVKKFSGGSWVQVGGNVGGAPGFKVSPSLAFNPISKKPYVALIIAGASSTGFYSVYFYNGTEWEVTGPAEIGPYSAESSPSLTFDPLSGEPYIAYRDGVLNAIVIKKYNGSVWEQIGEPSGNAAPNTSPSIAFNNAINKPYIAYHLLTGSNKIIVVKRFDGTSWVNAGKGQGIPSSESSPSLAFDPVSNKPYIAFNDEQDNVHNDGTYGSYTVKKYKGSDR